MDAGKRNTEGLADKDARYVWHAMSQLTPGSQQTAPPMMVPRLREALDVRLLRGGGATSIVNPTVIRSSPWARYWVGPGSSRACA